MFGNIGRRFLNNKAELQDDRSSFEFLHLLQINVINATQGNSQKLSYDAVYHARS